MFRKQQIYSYTHRKRHKYLRRKKNNFFTRKKNGVGEEKYWSEAKLVNILRVKHLLPEADASPYLNTVRVVVQEQNS